MLTENNVPLPSRSFSNLLRACDARHKSGSCLLCWIGKDSELPFIHIARIFVHSAEIIDLPSQSALRPLLLILKLDSSVSASPCNHHQELLADLKSELFEILCCFVNAVLDSLDRNLLITAL